jgi:leucyl/phenylalanyl-tRNA--protein transferase
MSGVIWLSEERGATWFPPVSSALKQPEGLLAVGGNLSPERLLAAYEQGIFPWYSAGQPVLWWAPDPRAVLFPEDFHTSRSLRRRRRDPALQTRFDTAFTEVIEACAAPRPAADGTWLTPQMRAAYTALHALGYAHSVETWRGEWLVGGLYGVQLGRVFFGESMFSRESDASKVALARLVERARATGIALIDCQIASGHLQSLGSRQIPREHFQTLLQSHCRPHAGHRWT